MGGLRAVRFDRKPCDVIIECKMNAGGLGRSTARLSASRCNTFATAKAFVKGRDVLGKRSSDLKVVCKASNDEESSSSTVNVADDSIQALKRKRELEKEREKQEIEKGQRTAVFTGAIAIFLGVAYLLVVQLLDSRGSVLQPPPPEAFL